MSDISALSGNIAPFTLGEIANATRGQIVSRANIEYSMLKARGVSSDTRHITPQSVFVALRGERFDGHNFLAQAKNAGAIVAVVEDAMDAPADLVCVQVENTLHALGDLARYHRNRFNIPVIGITGSYGKTTTRAFLQAALSPLGNILASRENFNNEIGVPQTLFGLNESHQAAIVEMGMRGLGQIEYLAKVARPTIGVITNIGPQHIEMLGSLENIARAKAELIQQLPQDGIAIFPSEGDYSELLLQIAQERGCEIINFGMCGIVDVRLLSPCRARSSFDIHVLSAQSANESVEVECFTGHPSLLEFSTFVLPLPGVHNAANAAAALAVAYRLGVDLQEAAHALETVDVPGARMKVRRANEIVILDDCYNAGPNSMRAALETLRDWNGASRRVAVLGTMMELGSFSDDEHRKLIETANGCCDFVIGVGKEICYALQNTQIDNISCTNANEAALRVLDVVKSGDVILVKGSRSVGLEIVVQKLVNS